MCHRRLTRSTRVLEWLREAQKSTQKLAPKVLVQLAVPPGSSDASCANAVVPSCVAAPFATCARWMSIERMQFVERKELSESQCR